MTTRKHPTDPLQPDFDDHEWQAQERAMHEARDGVATARDDALAARYRAISEALRQPPMPGIPPRFAMRVARRAAAAGEAADERFERVLTQVLLAALGVAVVVISVLDGSRWLHALGLAMPSGAGSWLAVLVACVGLHGMLARWQRNRAIE